MEKLRVEDISMNYHSLQGETPTLLNICFSLDEGEFVSIVGPSGCGKSTILNIIAGLIKPSFGDIYIDNEKVTGCSTRIGYMFQKDHLFGWLSVWENVTLGLKVKGRVTKEQEELVKGLLEKYKLWEFKNHFPRQLSGGMRQRVALIRTLTLNPELLLLDEPFSALDYQTRLNLSSEIGEIIKKEKKTALMVTHDISEAVSMSNRVLVLSKRPAAIKFNLAIDFPPHLNSLERREHESFKEYFKKIWKEMDSNEERE